MITLQFQPNWRFGERLVIEALALDGVYRSQFVTGISNGGLGGDRWRWESRLFAGRYDELPGADRPVYGVWNRRDDSYGGAIRFGSSYLRLKPEAIDRSTFCFPDSARDPEHFGDASVLPQLCRLADDSGFDDLDEYVEAQVHGAVRLDTDVDAVVLDPSFIGTPVEEAAHRLGCPVEYHAGFRATPDAFDPAYRGQHIVDLARELGAELTPERLGHAARSGVHPAQSIKQVWHCLARFGRTRD
ncbi:DUF3626 domain-containing protein [Kribbella kalugense]|uniref:Uncharacterized protein DUF3626 n=1 Tax=Kribbella kalugense TaxID=2512221 RepID=A0A4R7ZWP8_9ACTN|nr:DUF3626 domain-containing protein [Kribbella kalugense]TDW22402.1 uncharacterized protein DUF3626 [Kribbella kalugense]